MARSRLQLRIAQSPVLRYGLAVLSVSVALGGALLIERLQLHNITLFLFAIAVAAWYGGTAPAALAFLLSCISLAYFFVEPSHTLYISRPQTCRGRAARSYRNHSGYGAAARLGLKRTTLIAKMKKLGISRPVRKNNVNPLTDSRKSEQWWQLTTE
jgi:hypothetical protein